MKDRDLVDHALRRAHAEGKVFFGHVVDLVSNLIEDDEAWQDYKGYLDKKHGTPLHTAMEALRDDLAREETPPKRVVETLIPQMLGAPYHMNMSDVANVILAELVNRAIWERAMESDRVIGGMEPS